MPRSFSKAPFRHQRPSHGSPGRPRNQTLRTVDPDQSRQIFNGVDSSYSPVRCSVIVRAEDVFVVPGAAGACAFEVEGVAGGFVRGACDAQDGRR